MLVLAFTSWQSAAQKSLQQGRITFEAEHDEAEEEDFMTQLATGSMSLEYIFDKDHVSFQMNMMMGMMGFQSIVDIDGKAEPVMLMNMLGQRYQIIGMAETDMQQNQDPLFGFSGGNIEYDKKDRKDIAGYPCYKATLHTDEGISITYYITEKIAIPGAERGKGKSELKGFPLEIRLTGGADGLNMVLVANSIDGEVPGGAFDVPEGYRKVTMAELESEMGGMLPFGGN